MRKYNIHETWLQRAEEGEAAQSSGAEWVWEWGQQLVPLREMTNH